MTYSPDFILYFEKEITLTENQKSTDMGKHPFILLTLVFMLLLISCSRSLPKQQAEKHLKAFDSELINLSKQVSETMAYKAVHELFMIRNLPLPFQYTSSDEKASGAYVYDFEEQKGIYSFNTETQLLEKTGSADSLIIVFPFVSKLDQEARFILIDYTEENSAFGIMFPTRMEAKIEIKGHVVFELNSSSTISHGFPVKSKTEISFSKFQLNNYFETRLSKRKGVIKQNLQFTTDERSILSIHSRIVAGMNEQMQLEFRKVEVDGDIFPIRFTARVDQDKISHDAARFIESFNANADILVYKLNSRKKIGRVYLKEIPGVNRLNFFLNYGDGTTVELQKMLFGIDEIMNMKL